MTYELREYMYEVDSDELVFVSIRDWPPGLSPAHALEWLRFHIGDTGYDLWLPLPEAPDEQILIGVGFRWPGASAAARSSTLGPTGGSAHEWSNAPVAHQVRHGGDAHAHVSVACELDRTDPLRPSLGRYVVHDA